jgi:hypothetical protein
VNLYIFVIESGYDERDDWSLTKSIAPLGLINFQHPTIRANMTSAFK